MSTAHAPSLTRTATWIVLGALVLAVLLPAGLWLSVGAWREHVRVESAARAIAWLAARDGGTAPPGAAGAGLGAALDLPAEGTRLRWASSEPTDLWAGTEIGDVPAWPTVAATAPAGATTVRVERSLRPLLVEGLAIGVAGSVLALVAWSLGLRRSFGRLARTELHVRSHASLDPLTGLLNRDGLRRRLQRSQQRRRAGDDLSGVLLIDMDRFGLINETLGQAAGDMLLRSVADRIRSVTRAGDGLARFGGDQFVVHVISDATGQALTAAARNLLRAFRAPFALDGRDVVATFSIGVAQAGGEGMDADELLHRAALGLRAAKKQGGNRFQVHEPDVHVDDIARRLDIEQRLHRALGARQFFLLYQPIVAASDERTHAVETLLRWRDPERGVISPVDFIPALEQTGLIVPVGRWVLREACQQLARWPGAHPPAMVSVNLSPRQFAEPELLRMVDDVLHEAGLAPERLQLEVTEGLLLEPSPEAMAKLRGLAERGVRLAIDDFGIGYSSLVYLKRFQLHALKIDRMFVRDLAEREQDLTIARAIVDLGHGLGMRVTAEGVETRAQSDALRALGCDSLQGYLYGRPVPVEALYAAPAAGREADTGPAPADAPGMLPTRMPAAATPVD